MNITVTLHCEGFQRPCSSSISTGLRDALGETPRDFLDGKLNVTVPLLMQSARQGGWDVRPVATDEGSREVTKAWCRHCAKQLYDHMAALAVDLMARASDTPPEIVNHGDTARDRHSCATPTYSGNAGDYRTGEIWSCQCGITWAANREDASWTIMRHPGVILDGGI